MTDLSGPRTHCASSAAASSCRLGTLLGASVDSCIVTCYCAAISPWCSPSERAEFSRCRPILTCRQMCAISLMSGSSFKVRWIASELNPADAPSRCRRVAHRSPFEAANEEAIQRVVTQLWRGRAGHGDRAACPETGSGEEASPSCRPSMHCQPLVRRREDAPS